MDDGANVGSENGLASVSANSEPPPPPPPPLEAPPGTWDAARVTQHQVWDAQLTHPWWQHAPPASGHGWQEAFPPHTWAPPQSGWFHPSSWVEPSRAWHAPDFGYGPPSRSDGTKQHHSAKRERSRSRSPKPVRDEQFLRFTLLSASIRKALQDDDLQRVITSIKEVHALNRKLPDDLLYAALEAACKKVGGSKCFVAMLHCCAFVKLRLCPNKFSTLLGILMSRRACSASVRALLNAGLPHEAPVIDLVPEGCTEEEAQMAFEDIPKDLIEENSKIDEKNRSNSPAKEDVEQTTGEDERGQDGADQNTKQSSSPSLGDADLDVSSLNLKELRGILHSPRAGVTAYFGHFLALLHLERLAELETFRRRFSRMPVDRLIDTGFALAGLKVVNTSGRRKSRKAGLPGWEADGSESVTLQVPHTCDLTRLRIKKGESVIVSRTDPRLDALGEGHVNAIDGSTLTVNLSSYFPDDGHASTWRVDMFALRVVYERQMTALLAIIEREQTDPVCQLLVSADVGRLDMWAANFSDPHAKKEDAQNEDREQGPLQSSVEAEGSPPHAVSNVIEAKSDETHVSQTVTAPQPQPNRCVELASVDPHCETEEAAAQKRKKVEELVQTYENLNTSQRSAVIESVTRRCAIVQGPPGTGKTHVSVKVLHTWVKSLGLSPILATSDSNVAVDNIAEGLTRIGIRAVRVGRPEKCREHLEGITLDNLAGKRLQISKDDEPEGSRNSGEDVAATKRIRTEDVQKSEKDGSNTVDAGNGGSASNHNVQSGISNAEDEPKQVQTSRRRQFNFKEEKQAREEVLEGAEVICITTVSAGGDVLKNFSFRAVLIDEVAQATEVSTIVPVVMCGAQQLVLVGDHCQLAPTCLSREAEMRGLSLSLYQRLADAGIKPSFLDTQYRSHPKLAEFSAKCFYRGELKSEVAESSRPVPHGLPWPNPSIPVAFFEVGAHEKIEGESKANPSEAEVLVHLVEEVLRAGELGIDQIGIVAPYMAQVRLLRRLFKERLPHDPNRHLEVASVDNYQGREKELILFSAVRCNRHGNVGFLADWRRLNVLLTRARRGLVIVGSAETLAHDSCWKQWLEWCRGLEAIGDAAESWFGKNRGKRRHDHAFDDEDWYDEDQENWVEEDAWDEYNAADEMPRTSPFASSSQVNGNVAATASPFASATSSSTSASPFGGMAAPSPFAPPTTSAIGAKMRYSPFGQSVVSPTIEASGGQLEKRARYLLVRQVSKRAKTSMQMSVPWREIQSDMSDEQDDCEVPSPTSEPEGAVGNNDSAEREDVHVSAAQVSLASMKI